MARRSLLYIRERRRIIVLQPTEQPTDLRVHHAAVYVAGLHPLVTPWMVLGKPTTSTDAHGAAAAAAAAARNEVSPHPPTSTDSDV